jgi:alpha-glucosidase
VEKLVKYYGMEEPGAHLPFNCQLILARGHARHIAQLIDEYERHLPENGWPNWVLGNHDQHRIATRVGKEQARVAAMLLLTLRGTPTMYYGDEIGMTDVAIPPARVQDPYERNVPGQGLGRDPERTPMQWSTAPNAGFTAGEPWLPLADDSGEVNVELEQQDRSSILSLYRRLIELRRGEPALEVGRYLPVKAAGDVLAYLREKGPRRLLVALNLGGTLHRLEVTGSAGVILISTRLDREGERVEGALELRPHEGVVVRLEG